MSSGIEVGDIFGRDSGLATALLRSPTVLFASIGFWGFNVYLFNLFQINHIAIVYHDNGISKSGSYHLLSNTTQEIQIGQNDDATSSERDKDIEIQACGITKPSHENPETNSSAITRPRIKRKHELAHESISGSFGSSGERTMDADDDNYGHSDPKGIFSKSVDEPQTENTVMMLLSTSIGLLALLYVTSTVWVHIFYGTTLGAVFFFYAMLFLALTIPLQETRWMRLSFRKISRRVLILIRPRFSCLGLSDPKPIPFIDVFMADAMCSLSKVFFDWGMLLQIALYYPHAVPSSGQAIILPSLLATLPYLIRARQCLIMYFITGTKADRQKCLHLLNAMKYLSSLLPLMVSAYQKTYDGQQHYQLLDYLLISLLIFNSAYCLVWDVVMDWGMMTRPSALLEHTIGRCAGNMMRTKSVDLIDLPSSQNLFQSFLRPNLRFGAALSILIIFLDVVLRFSWLLRFVENEMFTNSDEYILCSQFLEVFRRAMWNLLRVEWEGIRYSIAMNKL